MKEKIKLVFICIVTTMLICGCDNSNKNSNVNKIKEEIISENTPDINDENHNDESKIIKNDENVDTEINNNKTENESADEMIIQDNQNIIENNDDDLLDMVKENNLNIME